MAPRNIGKGPSELANGEDNTNENANTSLIKDRDGDVETNSGPHHATKKDILCRYIDVEMIPAKIAYLFWGGLIGTSFLYLNAFLKSIGLPMNKVGIITGTGLALASITGPLWGFLTDATKSPTIVLTLMSVGAAAAVSSQPFIAAALPKNSYDDLCLSQLKSVNGVQSFISNVTFSNAVKNKTSEDCLRTEEDRLFYTFLVMIGFGSIFYLNIQNYADANALKTIKTSRRGATYGAQRVFGAIGATAAINLTAALLAGSKSGVMSKYSNAFFIYAPYALMTIPTGLYLIHQYQQNKKIDETSQTSIHTLDHCAKDGASIAATDARDASLLQDLCITFSNLDVIVLMFTVFIAGVAYNLYIFFTVFLVKEQLSISDSERGVILSGLNIANIIMFPFTGPVIKLLRGPKPAILLGVAAHCIRSLVMSYTRTYWVMLSVQILHSLDFALLFAASMEYIHHISPQKILTTMIMILESLHFGFSAFFINIVGGVVCEKFDGKTLFRGVGLLSGVWTIILALYYGLQHKNTLRNNKNNDLVLENKKEFLVDEEANHHESY